MTSVEATVAKILKNGGRVLVGKIEIPGMGFYAIFTDSEDNTVSIMERT